MNASKWRLNTTLNQSETGSSESETTTTTKPLSPKQVGVG